MKRYDQQDLRWGEGSIGKSKAKIKDCGCLITSLCMLHSKFYPKHPITPDIASKTWEFVSVPKDRTKKYLSWTGTEFEGMEFVWRNWGYDPDKFMLDPIEQVKDLEIEIIKKYCKSKDYGIVFQVLTRGGGQHWVAGVGKSIFGWSVNDPWDGKRLWRFPKPYPRIIGWSLMEKTE